MTPVVWLLEAYGNYNKLCMCVLLEYLCCFELRVTIDREVLASVHSYEFTHKIHAHLVKITSISTTFKD